MNLYTTLVLLVQGESEILLKNNKMQIGFGISSAEEVKRFSPFCDGVIVGSAVVKSLSDSSNNFSETIDLVKKLKSACMN